MIYDIFIRSISLRISTRNTKTNGNSNNLNHPRKRNHDLFVVYVTYLIPDHCVIDINSLHYKN